jgi:hypothetical protein
MSKPLKNGHAPEPAAEVPNANTIRTRRYRERKAKGLVVLRDIEVTPDLAAALTANGWLHESERGDRAALLAAIGACLYKSLSSGVTPSSDKALLAVDMRAVEAALPWLKPGEAVTPESAGRAVGIVSKCAAQVNFSPSEYASRARRMAGIN